MQPVDIIKKARQIENIIQERGIDFVVPAIGSPKLYGTAMSSKLLLVFAYELGAQMALERLVKRAKEEEDTDGEVVEKVKDNAENGGSL